MSSRADLDEISAYFQKRLERFDLKMARGGLGSKLLGITKTPEQGVMVASVTLGHTYDDVHHAARENGGYAKMFDTSRCSETCTVKKSRTSRSGTDCACVQHTLERLANVWDDQLPCDRIYSLNLCLIFPVRCTKALLNLREYMRMRGLTPACVTAPPKQAIMTYVDTLLAQVGVRSTHTHTHT